MKRWNQKVLFSLAACLIAGLTACGEEVNGNALDPFFRQFEAQYELMQEIGTPLRRIVLLDWSHGFGGDGGWIQDYADWLEEIFSETE